MLSVMTLGTVCPSIGLTQPEHWSDHLVGKPAPEIVSKKENWFNTDHALTLKELRGRPVFIEFGILR
jgi:hypothetical protein